MLASGQKGTLDIRNLPLVCELRLEGWGAGDLLSAAGVVGGYRCFQKVVWARQAAPNMPDKEGPQRFISFLPSRHEQHVTGTGENG